jgi:hypothetical protein
MEIRMTKTQRSKPHPDSPRSFSKERRAHEVRKEKKQEKVSRENRNFTQVYERGWNKLNILLQECPSAARFWVFLAEQIDTSGALVATQGALAKAMGVKSTKTIQRWSETLENHRSLLRVPLSGGVYAYALNPEEVWKAYDKDKEFAIFNTKTLVNTMGGDAARIRRKIKILMDETGPARKPKNKP